MAEKLRKLTRFINRMINNSIHTGKNGFTEVSENLARYRSENNFVRLLKM